MNENPNDWDSTEKSLLYLFIGILVIVVIFYIDILGGLEGIFSKILAFNRL